MPTFELNLEATRLAAQLLRLGRRLFPSENVAGANLPLAQLRLCSILAEGPRTLSQIRRELDVSQSAVTQLADRLERTRLVRRVTGGDDRRVRTLELTDRGQTLMKSRETYRTQRVLGMLSRLRPEVRESLPELFAMLIEACGEPAAPEAAIPRELAAAAGP